MTTPLSAAVLIVAATADAILTRVLEVAELVGLPVQTWRAGDPTRTLFKSLAEVTAERDLVQAEFAKGAAMSTAEGDWATIRALETFNVERTEETFSTPTVVFDNTGGGVYEFEPGGMVFSASATGATFTNQSTVTVAALETGVSVLLIAQQGGSAGTVDVDDIDGIVTPAIAEFEIDSSTASIGADEQSEASLREDCANTLGSFSANGPFDAYAFVAKSEDLTGIAGIVRASASGDNSTGTVAVYAATGTAGIDGATVTAIQSAIDVWATPLCTLATVASGTPQEVDITASGIAADFRDAVLAGWAEHFLSIDFAGTVHISALEGVAFAVLVAGGSNPAEVNVAVTAPVADVVLATGAFPVVGDPTWF